MLNRFWLKNTEHKEEVKMNAANTLKKLGMEQTFNYIYKDPDKNMNKIMDWADKLSLIHI